MAQTYRIVHPRGGRDLLLTLLEDPAKCSFGAVDGTHWVISRHSIASHVKAQADPNFTDEETSTWNELAENLQRLVDSV